VVLFTSEEDRIWTEEEGKKLEKDDSDIECELGDLHGDVRVKRHK